MKSFIRLAWLAALAAGATAPTAAAQDRKTEPRECVGLAKSWDAAVAEARLLNVPLVVHNHGFYCGPCWGMHSAVLENKKYMAFARKNCVDVATVGQLEKGIESNDPRAATYAARGSDGQAAHYLVHWPGLTREELLALGRSKAAAYNQTGKVPYTAIVDPHTLEEVKQWLGGTGAKAIMEEVTAARKQLVKTHGPGASRAILEAIVAVEAEIGPLVEAGELGKAAARLDKAVARGTSSEALTARIEAARSRIRAAFEARLDRIRAQAPQDPAGAQGELEALLRKLRGSGFEDEARALLEELGRRGT